MALGEEQGTSAVSVAGDLRRALAGRLSPARLLHVLGVEGLAVELARRWRVDAERVMMAALLHDYFKAVPRNALAELLRQACGEWGPTEEDWQHPAVWHGLVAADWARRELGITDREILQAVHFHTTGTRNLGAVGLVLYVADSLEPTRHFPGVEQKRREILPLPLYAAAHEVSKIKLSVLARRESPPHGQTRQMSEWLATMVAAENPTVGEEP